MPRTSLTETRSSAWRESWGQGIANIASAFFGGTGGCAMIGQTVINVKTAGARTRVSTFAAGASVLVLTIVLHDLVAQIPMAALTAVMLMVCVATFDWHSVRPRTLGRMPLGETLVIPPTGRRVPGTTLGVLEQLLALLDARRIGIELSDEDQLHPEQSTSAIVLHHPQARYFNV